MKHAATEEGEEEAEVSRKPTPFWSMGMYATAFAAALVIVRWLFIPEGSDWDKPTLAAMGLAFVVVLVDRIRETR